MQKGIHTLERTVREIRRLVHKRSNTHLSLAPPLPLPAGTTERQLHDFVTSVRVQGAPEAEMRAYGANDFRRFVYTWGLGRDIKGRCLELGGNPYFTTMLLKRFTSLDISVANWLFKKIRG
uniref:Uncharacterized protein n=1 Tax=Candidatus Kentrum sp. TC TaxID=2126339 RepID=A0A450YEL3_9GAMM|nr:MAG: hypothetical protein BECKTC1821D_GA0114238_10084 [Candidatus Kentron sp. TC]